VPSRIGAGRHLFGYRTRETLDDGSPVCVADPLNLQRLIDMINSRSHLVRRTNFGVKVPHLPGPSPSSADQRGEGTEHPASGGACTLCRRSTASLSCCDRERPPLGRREHSTRSASGLYAACSNLEATCKPTQADPLVRKA